ncbi:retrovirus-related Pol polyprotein from transposon 412 [Trichonephila clavipes]|nr:retrovirus-related Pol polyprotein from transposon 412 [Trichonephila clavipes]
MKTRYDTKATGHQFKEGDKVWFYNPTRRKGLSPKLQSHWDGPYTILKIINDVVIRIQGLHPGSDGLVRVICIRTSRGLFTRNVASICPLRFEENVGPSSTEY